MKALLVLIVILFAYYQVYYRFPEYVSNKTHIYLGVFTELPLSPISNIKMEMNYIQKGSNNPKKKKQPEYLIKI